MRVVLQRVSRAEVRVGGERIGGIGRGVLVLVGFEDDDGPERVDWMAEKISGLRIFSDEDGKMNRSVEDVGGGVLVVSQFTLYGDVTKGRRPSFAHAARPEVARPLYETFVGALGRITRGVVETGEFGAAMEVDSVNDGPVTLVIERG